MTSWTCLTHRQKLAPTSKAKLQPTNYTLGKNNKTLRELIYREATKKPTKP